MKGYDRRVVVQFDGVGFPGYFDPKFVHPVDVPAAADLADVEAAETLRPGVELRRATDLVDELRKHVISRDKAIELRLAEIRRLHAERDELRAHGVARDIGEANEQLRAELEALCTGDAERMSAMVKAGTIPPGGYRLLADIYVDAERHVTLGQIRGGVKISGLYNIGPVVLRPLAEPDTEATEQPGERDAALHEALQEDAEVDAPGPESICYEHKIGVGYCTGTSVLPHADWCSRNPATPTEPRKPWPSPMWHEQPCKTCDCDACDHDPTAEPRVWHKEQVDRAQPPDVAKVIDRHNDIWTCTTTDVWTSPETVDCGWSYILRKFGPLTEVVETTPSGIPDSISTSGDPIASGTAGDSRDAP